MLALFCPPPARPPASAQTTVDEAEAFKETTTQQLAEAHLAANQPTSPFLDSLAGRSHRFSSAARSAAAVATSLFRREPSSPKGRRAGETREPRDSTASDASVGELPPLKALEQHSAPDGALRPTRLVPALVAALAVGVLVGVVRRRVS